MLNMNAFDAETDLLITGGEALLAEGFSPNQSIAIANGRIQSIGGLSKARTVVDASGLLVLPGIVDLHGDAFERQLMPRPGVFFPHSLALLETDNQLLANGITTAYHGVTWSWEAGLRGKQAAYAFFDALEAARGRLGCDTRLHLRFETHNLDDLEEVAACLAGGRVQLLAFNDHTGHLLQEIKNPGKIASLAGRSGMEPDAYRARLHAMLDRKDDVPAALARLSAMVEGSIPMASHDDDTAQTRAWYRGLGCAIAEFPTSLAAAQAAREHGDHVVMGAPNVLRGKSHTSPDRGSRMSARTCAGDGLCTVLASDYYYPSLMEAPFVLAREGILPLDAAWKLVAENPARAAGLADRGRLAPGMRADIVLVDTQSIRPRIVATVAGGRLVHAGPQAFPRMTGPQTADTACSSRVDAQRSTVAR